MIDVLLVFLLLGTANNADLHLNHVPYDVL